MTTLHTISIQLCAQTHCALIEKHGKGGGPDGWSSNVCVAKRRRWKRFVMEFPDGGNLADPEQLARHMMHVWGSKPPKNLKDRIGQYTCMRASIKQFLFRGEQPQTLEFEQASKKGYTALGGTELSTTSVQPVLEITCCEETAKSLPDITEMTDADLALMLYTAKMNWQWVVSKGEKEITFPYCSPLPQRCQDLMLGIGSDSGFDNYIEERNGTLYIVATKFKTSSKGSYVCETVPEHRLQLILRARIAQCYSKHHRALFPRVMTVLDSTSSSGFVKYDFGDGAMAKAIDTVGRLIGAKHKALLAEHKQDGQYCTGISAHRASYIIYAVNIQEDGGDWNSTRSAYEKHHVFMMALAKGMRHSVEEQTWHYLFKEMKSARGSLKPIPWKMCAEAANKTMEELLGKCGK
jgi:hypothetical protein